MGERMIGMDAGTGRSQVANRKAAPIFVFLCALCYFFCTPFHVNSSFGEDKNVHIVKIKDFNYHPPELIIYEGDTVLWDNEMPYGHWVISGADMKHDNRFFSPLLLKDHKFNHTFEKPVVQDYYCPIHSMQGRITVLERKGKARETSVETEKKEPEIKRRRVKD